MNQAEVSGLLRVGLHDTNGDEEAYATEYPNMNQDSAHETTKFDVLMATPAMYSDRSNADACLDGYQHTGMMAEIQPIEEVGFVSTQHFEGVVADSEEENLSSSNETSSTTNYDTPGYMDPNLQNIYNACDEMGNAFNEMVDKEGPVVLYPDLVMCDTISHLHPHLTFSSDGLKIEHFVWDSCEDEEMIALYWDICDIIYIDSKWTHCVESAFMTLLVGTSEENRTSGPVRIKVCLTDPQWPQKQQKICHLASRYQEVWNNISSDGFVPENWSIEPSLFFPKQYFSGTVNFEDVIYPKGDPDAVSISSRDVELLLPETFVNDTIIDFYIKYLSTRIQTTEKRRYHFFNSFFFRKLADLDKDQGRAPEGRSAFLRVRKWTRKIDVFSKDFLFIPVNFNLHWSLIVICYPGEVDTFQDDETKRSGNVPCILHMDSLKGSHSGLKDIIQSYLWEEWKERHPESASNSSDKFLNLRFVSLELPQQDNSFDCGLFLLHYVEHFLMDAPSSFNPLKIDIFSSFLSEDWFVPADASLKRSLIRKLIDELVTESSQSSPKLACGNEQLDGRHQRSENAERELAKEFLAEGCSAGGLDSVCTIPGTRQKPTSVCLNDSEKQLAVSGCILETPGVSVLHLQEMQVCPPHNDTVVSLDMKNEAHLADCDNQLDLRSCASESAEAFKGNDCVVKDKDTNDESLLVSLNIYQKISSQAEVEVHDMMDSKCCSLSDNALELMACQKNALERNTNEDDDCCEASEDMDSATMLDAGKHGIGPDLESTKGKVDDGRCDLPEDTDSVEIGDINKDVSDSSIERNIVDAEYGRCDISEDMGSVLMGDINKDVAERSFERNVVEYEDTKHEDSHADPITVDDAIKDNTKESSTTVDKINGSDPYVPSDLKEGNTNNGMISGSTVSCYSKEGSTDSVMAGDGTNGTGQTHAEGEDAHDNLVTGEAARSEDDTTCTDAEMPHVDSSSSAKNETVSENTTCDAKRPHPDSISEDKNMLVSDKCPQEDSQCCEAKSDRRYKRRKVMTLKAGKRCTRSSSMAPSLD